MTVDPRDLCNAIRLETEQEVTGKEPNIVQVNGFILEISKLEDVIKKDKTKLFYDVFTQ